LCLNNPPRASLAANIAHEDCTQQVARSETGIACIEAPWQCRAETRTPRSGRGVRVQLFTRHARQDVLAALRAAFLGAFLAAFLAGAADLRAFFAAVFATVFAAVFAAVFVADFRADLAVVLRVARLRAGVAALEAPVPVSDAPAATF